MMTVAFWCVLAAGVLPYLPLVLAKRSPAYDNANPRLLPAQAEGLVRRAYGAHNNGLEALPFFAAGVIIASLAGGGGMLLNSIALLWVAVRVLYMLAYLGDRPGLRSVLWMLSYVLICAMFVLPVVISRVVLAAIQV